MDDRNNSQEPITPQTGYPNTAAHSATPKKKARRSLVPLFIVILLLLSGAAIVFAFKSTLVNTFALLTMSPKEYYAYVEKNTIDETVDHLTPYLNISTQDAAYDVSTDITFHREALDSVMQTAFGTSLTDMEASTGLPIESVGFNVLLGYNKDLMSDTLKLRLNQVDVITLELFMDTINQQMLLRLPELSLAYVKQSLTTGAYDINMGMTLLELMTSDRSADFIKRYGRLLVDQINQVELEKNSTLTLDTLSIDCNKLTITISEAEASTICMAMIEEAKKDEDILAILPMYEISEEEFVKELEGTKTKLTSFFESNTAEDTIQMHVYVDHYGKIIGRDFTQPGSSAAISYTFLSKDNYDEYRIYLIDETGNELLTGTGSQTEEQGAYDGTFQIKYNDPASESTSNVIFDFTYEDVLTDVKDARIYQYGTYTLSSLKLMGVHISLENSVADDIQYNKLIFRMGASPLVTIDVSSEFLPDYVLTMPSETAEIYDETQLDDYQATFKVDAYLKSFAEKLGVDVQVLYDLFQYSLSPE